MVSCWTQWLFHPAAHSLSAILLRHASSLRLPSGSPLTCNGSVVGSGNGAAVLGHPAEAVAWLANKLAEFGVGLLAGQLVLPGAMCAAASAHAEETYCATFSHLGEVSICFV